MAQTAKRAPQSLEYRGSSRAGARSRPCFVPVFTLMVCKTTPVTSRGGAACPLCPAGRLGYFRTAQIENQNDCCWSNPECDKLWDMQSQELDPQKRKDVACKMQELFYQETPYIVLMYPKLLEAWNTSRWEGWQRIPQPNGAVAFITDNVSNYSKAGPKTAIATTTASSSNVGLIVGVAIAALVVVGIVVLLLRRKPRAEEG